MNYSGQRKYVMLHWKRLAWLSLQDFLQWSIMIITIAGSIVAFLPTKDVIWLRAAIPYYASTYWGLAVLLLLLVMGLAVLRNWPRTRAVYKDKKTDIWVIIECCDLLQQKGLKVVHTVDTFDTDLARIISPRSLHGAFLKLCEQAGVHADEQIDATLEHLVPRTVDEKLPGRKRQYGLGTVCRVNVGAEPYACVAFTRLQPNGTIEITQEEYIRCLKQMWRNLSNPINRNDIVNVAVMGNKFVDLPAEFSTEQKIDLVRQATKDLKGVKVINYDCLTVEICRQMGIRHIIRGVRNFLDFETEQSIADANRRIAPEIETIIIPTSQEYSHISSSAVRDLIRHDGDAALFMPEGVKLPEKKN